MTIADIRDPRMLKTVLTADGREWVRACYVCGKVVDFIKTMPHQRVRVGNLVRHSKCRPAPVK